MNPKNAQEEIKTGKPLIECSNETLDYIKKPIGKTLYNTSRANPNDRIKCNICGKIFTRYNRTHHNKTQYHMIHQKVEEKFKKYLLDE